LTNVPNLMFAGMEQRAPILKVLTLVVVRKKPYQILILTLNVLA